MLQSSDAAWISCWQPNVNGKVTEVQLILAEKVKVAPPSSDETFYLKKKIHSKNPKQLYFTLTLGPVYKLLY